MARCYHRRASSGREVPAISSAPLKIALDVMGSERGVAEMVGGAIQAARDDGADPLLVGRRAEIERELARQGAPSSGIEVVDAPDVIGMAEDPIAAVRGKPESSLVVGVGLVRSGLASGFVSTGNTGALVTAAIGLRRVRGVERPALTTLFPTLSGRCLILDVGANTECRPEHLLQFGIMGATYLELVLKVRSPRVGLLSNGEEDWKGNTLVKEAHALMRDSSLNFVGNVEGKDIFQHAADVVVTDGFTGNVMLKVAEASGAYCVALLREEVKRDPISLLGGLLIKPAVARMRRRTDYDEYGGAPLLGVQGVCIKAHGRSNAKAIRSALRVARHAAAIELPDAIRRGIEPTLAAASTA